MVNLRVLESGEKRRGTRRTVLELSISDEKVEITAKVHNFKIIFKKYHGHTTGFPRAPNHCSEN